MHQKLGLSQRALPAPHPHPLPPAGHQAPSPDHPRARGGAGAGGHGEPAAGGGAGRGDPHRSRRAQQEALEDQAKKEDPLKEIDIEKFFEDYFDDSAERRSRPSEVPEMPPIENTLTESPDLYDHLTVAAPHGGLRRAAQRDRGGHHPEPRRGRHAAVVPGGDRQHGALSHRRGGEGARARAVPRSSGRGRAQPHRVPAPAAQAPGARGLAAGRDGPRLHEAAPEPPVPGDRPPDGPDPGGGLPALRDHQEPRSPAGQPLQPGPSRPTSCPTSSW